MKDIPGLGYLFGTEAKDGADVNIEFMIRPTISYTSQKNAPLVDEILEHDLDAQKKLGLLKKK